MTDTEQKFRCSRCRRTQLVSERRTIAKSWSGARFRTVMVCRNCGLAWGPDSVDRSEAPQSSPIAACEDYA